MKKLMLMLLAAGSLFAFNGCTKTGPPGPQGPAGYDGNANVIGTNPFTVSNWSYTSNAWGGNELAYYAEFSQTDVTNAVANFGMVMIYIQYADGSWKGLPDIVSGTSFSFNIVPGGFDLFYTRVDGLAPSHPGTQIFRTVIIPSNMRKAHPNTNWKNYNETMSVLNSNNTAVAATPQ